MTLSIDPSDVLVFNPDLDEKVVAILIKDGLAMARRVAPCIDEDDFAYPDAAAAIIRSAVLRWAESGSGALASESKTSGPYSVQTSFDTRQTRRSLFFPSEIRELEALCATNKNGAFAFDTIPQITPRCKDCDYIVGSLSAPCKRCGNTLRAGRW